MKQSLIGAAAVLLVAGSALADTTTIRTGEPGDKTKIRVNENTGKTVIRSNDEDARVKVRETPSGNTKVIVRDGDGSKTVIKP